MEEAPHGTRLLEAHDDVLVQCRRERRVFSDILPMHSSFELPEGDERGDIDESAPVFLSQTHASSSFTSSAHIFGEHPSEPD